MPPTLYVLLFEEVASRATPLMIFVDDRGPLPLFDSAAKVQALLDSTTSAPTDYGEPFRKHRADLLLSYFESASTARTTSRSENPAANATGRINPWLSS